MTILDKSEVERLYDNQASNYDASLTIFRLLGVNKWRASLVRQLELSTGDTVVDLCCGTGANIELLAQAVGETGRMIGVDLSSEMLAIAREKAVSCGLSNVELVQADVEKFRLPSSTSAVLSTFGLEMVPQYESVVSNVASQLPSDGRLGLLGLKHPDNWPDWLISLGIWMTKKYGVTREYEQFHPWEAADKYFQTSHFEQRLAGAAYICLAHHPQIDA